MTLFATLAAASSSASSASSAEGAAATAPGDNPQAPGSSSSSSSAPPAAVQLYASTSIDFLSGSIRSDDPNDPRSFLPGVAGGVPGAGSPAPSPRRGGGPGDAAGGTAGIGRRKFEVLGYQAVEAVDVANGSGGAAAEGEKVRLSGGVQAQRGGERKHPRPNLGVWDCRLGRPDGSVAGGGGGGGGPGDGGDAGADDELVDRLLGASIPSPGIDGSSATFVFAVDLSDPRSVYPAVNAMISSVLRRLDSAEPGSGSGTTKLSALRAAAFGAAPSSDATAPSVPASKDVRFNLVVAALVPSARSKKIPTFRDKQAQALVLYHLHRLAERADCTLAFVRSDGELMDIDEEGEGGDKGAAAGGKGMPSVTVSELAWAVRRVALGLPPLEKAASKESPTVPQTEGADAAPEGQEAEAEGTTAPPAPVDESSPPLHPPGSHDPDLVDTALLRNASCPGEWDASTDDLWKALPPPSVSSSSSSPSPATPSRGGSRGGSANAAGGGDQAWLSALAESVSVVGAGAGAGDDLSAAASAASSVDAKSVKSAKKKGAAGKRAKSAKAGGKKKGAGGEEEGPAAAAAKGDGDASAFFANLLKK